MESWGKAGSLQGASATWLLYEGDAPKQDSRTGLLSTGEYTCTNG